MSAHVDYKQIHSLAEELSSAINKEKGKRTTTFCLVEVGREYEAGKKYVTVQLTKFKMPAEIFYLIERSNTCRHHFLRLQTSSKERNKRLLKVIEMEILVIDMWIKCWFERELARHPRLRRVRKYLCDRGYRPFFTGSPIVLAETKDR